MEVPRMVQLILKAAERLEMSSRILDPEFGYLFEISHRDRTVVFVGGQSPLNDSSAARIATDKYYAAVVLKDAGFAVPETVRCLRPGFFKNVDYGLRIGTSPALQFAEERGYPLIVKPNHMALGRDVTAVRDPTSMIAAIERVWEGDFVALVQQAIEGFDLRVDILDGKLMVAYCRRPIVIYGDGAQTIKQLIVGIDSRYGQDGTWSRMKKDQQWQELVVAAGMSEDTVLAAGSLIDFGGTVMNLNRWATADLMSELADDWMEYCNQIGRAMNLRHFGVDLKVKDLKLPPCHATVIEVNSSPSLAMFADLGHENEAIEAEMGVLRAVFAS